MIINLFKRAVRWRVAVVIRQKICLDGKRRTTVTNMGKLSAARNHMRWLLAVVYLSVSELDGNWTQQHSVSFWVLPVFIDSCNCPNGTLHLSCLVSPTHYFSLDFMKVYFLHGLFLYSVLYINSIKTTVLLDPFLNVLWGIMLQTGKLNVSLSKRFQALSEPFCYSCHGGFYYYC